MTPIADVSPTFSVAGQLDPADVPRLAEQGYSTLICNRPDGEAPGQPDAASMRAAAEGAGIAFHHIPVAGGQFPAAALASFRHARRAAGGRTLAYCRSGTRSITLDALANPDGLSVDERLDAAARAGYDLSGLREWLRE